MRYPSIHHVLLLAALALPAASHARQWTLAECMDYARTHNLSLRRAALTRQSAQEDQRQSRAALLPSLSLGSSQNVTYNPWPQKGRAMVAGDMVQTSVDKTFYNGSYSIQANWTVWDGGARQGRIRAADIAERQAALDSAATAQTLAEQIAQLYVQILYTKEAEQVSAAAAETSRKNEERGRAFVEQGNMSRADLAQLSAQRAADEYSQVQAQSNLADYRRQMRQLLQLTDTEAFDTVEPADVDPKELDDIPAMETVYMAAVEHRPEILGAQAGIEASDAQMRIAKAGRMPTIGLNAGLNTNTTTMSQNAWGTQLKNNLNVGGGLNISVPLFDQRQTRTAVNKARIARQQAELALEEKKTTLHSQIESYWIQAMNNQAMYRSATESVRAGQESYELLSEQFSSGLINVIELMNGRNTLLRAQQQQLQGKYLTLLGRDMLRYYQGVIREL